MTKDEYINLAYKANLIAEESGAAIQCLKT